MSFLAFLWRTKFAELVVGHHRKRPLPTQRFVPERLEDRIILSVVGPFDTATPQSIPIGNTKAGQVVQLGVNFMTTDPMDQFEGEPLILVGSSGYSQIVSSYGKQTISFPITEDGETLSAYVQGADGDESATISVSSATAQVEINDTATTSDNITLLNPGSSGDPFIQTIPAKIINTSDATETFDLSIQQAGSGNVALSAGSVTLGAGQSTEVTLTPTADSSAANDVHLIASNEGVEVAEDDMTVVEVMLPRTIYNADTPAQMVQGGYYRIPPRVATPTHVVVTPDLSGSGQSVTLAVAGQSAADGTVMLDGGATENLTGTANANLTGGAQTTPGNAAKLMLSLQVRGEDTVQSGGFSVAAIPQNYTDSFLNAVTQANFSDGNGTVPARGLQVQDGWASDSGVLSDLDQVQLAEVVQYQPGTGAFASPGSNSNSSYLPATQFTTDSHANALAGLIGAIGAHGGSGSQQSLQTNKFEDARTGATDIPMTDSGYTITRTLYTAAGTVYMTTAKAGAATTADGISSAAGAGGATVTQVVETLPPGDPLVVTTQPPASVIAGQGFSLIITVENGDGSLNANFNGPVTLSSADGNALGGTLTVNAVSGVARFSGLTETLAGTDALDVTASPLPEVTSRSFNVAAAPAVRLLFLVPPISGVIAAAPFGVQVMAVDQYDNVDASYSGGVTLSLASNPGGATVGGNLTVNAVNGYATFVNVSVSTRANGYIMQAAAPGLASVTSSPFNVIDRLGVTVQPPDTVDVGGPFSVSIAAEDALGHIDTSFTGNVTLSDDNGNPLGGATTVAAVNGVATFTGLTLNIPGPDSLTADASNLPSATTTPFTVGAGKAVKIEIEGPGGPGTGNVISSPFGLDVEAVDANGNVDPTYNGTVTLSLQNNPGNSTLGGVLTVPVVQGEASFEDLTINNLGNGYTLRATATGLAAGISVPFDVTDQVVVTTQPPATIAAGAPFGLVVSAEAGLGNIDASYSGNITLTLSNYGSNNATLQGMLTEPAINGVATFSGLVIPQAGSYGLVVSGPALAGSATEEFTVSSSAATHLAFTTPLSGVTVGAGFSVNIAAEDAAGNVDTAFTGAVTLSLAPNAAGTILNGMTTVMAVSGVASFTGLMLNQVAAADVLSATSHGVATATSTAFAVTAAGVANQLVVSGQPPASVVAGSNINELTVSAEDGFGTVDTSFSGTVTLNLAANPGAATLNGTLTAQAANGIAIFSGLSIDQAGAGYAIAISAAGLAGTTTAAFTVTPAAATQLNLIVLAGPVLIGGSFTLQVNAVDPFGNLDTTFSGSVTISLANNPGAAILGGTLTVNASAGVAMFTGLTLDKPGVGFMLQAGGPGMTIGISPAFNVTADELIPSTEPPASVGVNTGFGFIVLAQDGTGNVDASFNGPVTVALVNLSNNSATLGGMLTVTAVNGRATFSGLTISQAGQYALSLTVAGIASGTTVPFSAHAVATQWVFAAEPPATITAGAPFSVAVAAEDASGNIDASFSGNVTLALAADPAGGVLGGTTTLALVNGAGTFTGLTLSQPGGGYTLKATGSGLAQGTSSAIQVAVPGVATQLVVTSQFATNIAAGQSFGLTVSAEDGAGNIDTSFTGNVTLALNSYSAAGGSTLGGTLTVAAVNGLATFSGLVLDAAGTYSVSAGAASLASAATPSFVVTPGSATQLTIALGSASVFTGAPFAVTVSAADQYGNIDPGFAGTITISLGANPANSLLGGTLTATAVNGVATFSGLTINNPDPGYTIQASANGVAAGVSSPFAVTNDRLVFTTQPPATVAPGAGFGVVVTAETGFGALDTLFNGSVTVALPPGSGDLLGGTTTVHVVNGVATFAGLTLQQAGFDTLIASSNGLAAGTSNLVNVTPAAAMLVATMAPPSLITAGAPFEIDVAVQDAFGNVDTGFTGPIMLTLITNPGGATLGGTLSVTAVNGIALFPGLTLDRVGAGYTIQAAGSGLASVNFNLSATPAGTATRLVITTEPPANVVGGAGFGLVVKAEDSFGTVDTSFSGSVTVADTSGTTPGGTLTVSAVNGLATFGGLTLVEGGDHLLTVSAGNLAGATSTLIVVAGAPATQFAIVGPGSSLVPGAPFGVTVLAVDSNGALDANFNGMVTLSLAGGSGGAIGGTTRVMAVNGVATFSGLTVNSPPAAGYSLQAAGNSLTGSAAFDVTSDQLTLVTPPPSSVPAGSPFGLTVSAENSSGNVDTSFSGPVTVTLISNADNNATLGGTVTVNAINGVATFSGLTINQLGSYSLAIAGTGVGGTGTNTILVTTGVAPASPAVPALGRVALPASVMVGGRFNGRIPVVITNTGGNVTGRFTIKLYADLGATLDGNEVLIATVRPRLSLKSGKSHTFVFVLHSLPRSLEKGTYHFLAQLTDPGGATNLIATNQTMQVAAPNVVLNVSPLAVIPSSIAIGKSGSIIVTITNTGTATAAGLLQITLAPSLDGISPTPGITLATFATRAQIGAHRTAKFKLHFKVTRAMPAGQYFPYISVSLDGIAGAAAGTTQFTIA